MKNKFYSTARNRLSMLLLLQLCCVVALAQVRISGKVTGPDGKGLPGISVVVKNTAYGASTDIDGNFNLTADLKPGTYPLEISGIGFKSKEQNVTIGTDNAYTVNAQLVEDPLGLDEYLVYDRDGAQYPPRSAVIFCFLDEYILAGSNYFVVLLIGRNCH